MVSLYLIFSGLLLYSGYYQPSLTQACCSTGPNQIAYSLHVNSTAKDGKNSILTGRKLLVDSDTKGAERGKRKVNDKSRSNNLTSCKQPLIFQQILMRTVEVVTTYSRASLGWWKSWKPAEHQAVKSWKWQIKKDLNLLQNSY